MKFINSIRALLSGAAMVVLANSAFAALEIFDSQGIRYDIVSEANKTVRVSNQNKTSFRNGTFDLTIPAQVYDVNTGTIYTDPFTVLSINGDAFNGCSAINSITIEAPIEEIPGSCFNGCTSLRSVTLPLSIKYLKTSAFQGCSALTSITGFDDLVKIENSVFSGCSSLPSITIPTGLQELGGRAFFQCSSLTSLDLEQTSVTVLYADTFYKCDQLQSVKLPKGLTTLNQYVFDECSLLKCPEFPANLSALPWRVFYKCPALGTVTLIPGLTVNSNAFEGSTIERLVFPTAEQIAVKPMKFNSEAFAKVGGMEMLTLPGWLEIIPDGLFKECKGIKNVTMNEGVKTIGMNAFNSCTSLTTVAFPSTLETIGASAFGSDTSLTGITLPTNLRFIKNSAFQGCSSLGKIVIPKYTSIEDYAFMNANLTGLEFAEGACGNISGFTFRWAYDYYNIQPNITELKIPGTLCTIDIPEGEPKEGKIPANLFQGFQNLKSVEIGEGIVTIEKSAFFLNDHLESVTLPKSLRRIEDSAFNTVKSLTSIEFNEGLEYIGNSAFAQVPFTELKFPSTLKQIGEINNKSTSEGAFSSNNSLTKVEFDKCEVIGDGTFGICRNIEELILPSNLKRIGAFAFSTNDKLATLTIPEGTEEINFRAFSGLRKLETLTLAAGTRIAGEAFWDCGTSNINFPETPCYFEGENIFKENKSLKQLILPLWLETIPAGMFNSCTQLSELTLGNNTKVISDNAFNTCTMLKGITFPESIERIGNNAFYACRLREEPETPETPDTNGYLNLNLPNLTYIGNNAFGGTHITDITFPENQIEMGIGVFHSTEYMTSVTLPEWMTVVPKCLFESSGIEHLDLASQTTNIDDKAFKNCLHLHDVDFPATVARIGVEAFQSAGNYRYKDIKFGVVTLEKDVELGDHCFQYATITKLIFNDCASFGVGCVANLSKLEGIKFPTCLTEIPDEFCMGWSSLSEVEFAPGTTAIGKKAFQSCESLRSITIPETVTSIGEQAFCASGLTEFKFPDNNIQLGTSIFLNCSGLNKVEISPYQKEISGYCFSNCKALTDVYWRDLEEGEKQEDVTICGYAFNYCPLSSFTFPDANLTLNDRAFDSSSITSIVWPGNDKSVTLGQCSFTGSKLTELSLPDGVTYIPKSCFSSCESLTSLSIGKNVTEIGDYAFSVATDYGTLVSHSKLKRIVWNDVLTKIGENAFSNCNVEELLLPDCVTSIGSQAFENNAAATVLHLPVNLTKMDRAVFYNCRSIPSVTIPETLTKIETRCFQGCSSLKTLTLHENLRSIEGNAFQDCVSLERLDIPASLSYISTWAFNGCTSLEQVVNNAEGIVINANVFDNCSSLKHFDSDVYVNTLGSEAFKNCKSLISINYNAKKPITTYGYSVFEGCEALQNADFFKIEKVNESETEYHISQRIGSMLFKDCKSLRQITIPTLLCNKMPYGIVQGCSSLESIVLDCDTNTVRINAIDITGASLKGISYSATDNIKVPGPTTQSINATISTYITDTGNTDYPSSPKDAILMVNRGERWKYLAYGYGNAFDIREIKNPQIVLQGDLKSQYNEQYNYNHYIVNLAWEAPLSDFNEKDEGTVYHVYRQDLQNEVGSIICSKPVYNDPRIKSAYPDNNIISVEVQYSGAFRDILKPDDNYAYDGFRGQIVYPEEDPNTNKNNNYCTESLWQDNFLVFDAETHRRLDVNEYNGYKSWIVINHEFDGPELNSEYILDKYVYRVEMEGYDYQVPVNNADFIPGDDEKLYHMKTCNEEHKDVVSNELSIDAVMGAPYLKVAGMYSYDEVKNDRDYTRLTPATNYNASQRYNMSFRIDETIATMKVRDQSDCKIYDMVGRIHLYKLNEEGKVDDWTKPIRTAATQAEFINGLSLTDLTPGEKYMIRVVSTGTLRGEFGSREITIPGVPQLASSMSLSYVDHFFNDYLENYSQEHLDGVAMKAQITLNPVCPNMAGESFIPAEGNYHLGMMRNMGLVRYNKPARAAASDDRDPLVTDDSDDQLIHHVEGRVAGTDDDMCDDCKSGIGLDTTGSNWVYEDHVVVPWGTDANLTYTPRLYARVPGSTIGYDEDQWMAADAPVGQDVYIYTNIEDMETVGNEEGLYYNLQGIRVQTPQRGVPVIKVTPRGAAKTLRLR